jgi:hypothetical protein
MSIREIRQKAGVSLTAAAALAGVAPPTWKCFELNPASITDAKRLLCERAVAEMQARARNAA